MEEKLTTDATVAKWLRRLKESIPKGADSVTATTVEVWSARLSRFPPDLLAAVALTLIERCTFFPSLAEIIEVCREITGEGKLPDKGSAYEEVMTAIRRVGIYRPCPRFSHPAIDQAVRAVGGWKYLCSSEYIVSDRARFFEVYEKYRDDAQRYETLPAFSKEIAAKYLKEIESRASGREVLRLEKGSQSR